MVDVDLKANTTKAENYRASGNIYGDVYKRQAFYCSHAIRHFNDIDYALVTAVGATEMKVVDLSLIHI